MSVYKGVSPIVKCKIENIVVLKVEGIRQGARQGSEPGGEKSQAGVEPGGIRVAGKERSLGRSKAWRGVEPVGDWSQVATGARRGAEPGRERSNVGKEATLELDGDQS